MKKKQIDILVCCGQSYYDQKNTNIGKQKEERENNRVFWLLPVAHFTSVYFSYVISNYLSQFELDFSYWLPNCTP